MAAIEQHINRASEAARLLTAADLVARQANGREYAHEQYLHIATTYPDLDAGTQANTRLQNF